MINIPSVRNRNLNFTLRLKDITHQGCQKKARSKKAKNKNKMNNYFFLHVLGVFHYILEFAKKKKN